MSNWPTEVRLHPSFPTPTHAITVRQPYAGLIVAGLKPYEFRSAKPPARMIGQRVAIHAGRSTGYWTFDRLALMPRNHGLIGPLSDPEAVCREAGVVVGSVVIGAPRRSIDIAREWVGGSEWAGEGFWTLYDRWAWPMIDPRMHVGWRTLRGRLGFWRLS